jgi:Subtilase family
MRNLLHRRAIGGFPLALAVLALAAAPIAGAAPGGGSGLSPRLAELARPPLWGAPPSRQAREVGLPVAGAGGLQREGKRLFVDVRFDRGAAASAADLRAAGAELVDVSRRYQTVTVSVEPADLHALAAVPGVEGVTENLAPIVFAAEAGCPAGGTVSEGDAQLRAAEARSLFGVDGSGITVGILSDSYDRDSTAATHAAADVSTGDLPGTANPCGQISPVNVLDDTEAGGADEGRAMAQIVHDLAPRAKLAFATAFGGETGFAGNIERLAQPIAKGGAGASVIADDVAYFNEPFFQDGPIAAAVDKVSGEGISYFSSAGNDNVLVGGKNIGSWEGPFKSTGSCPGGVPHFLLLDQFECTDFDGGGDTGFGITVKSHGSLLLDLQWAEPWYGVDSDLDAYLLSAGNVVAESENDNPGSTQQPFELLSWENTAATARTVELVIKRFSGSGNPQLKFMMLENGAKDVLGTEYPESSGSAVVGPTIFGHSAAAGAISVAAVPYNSTAQPEYYSSRGPAVHYFAPVSGTSPAAQLGSPEPLAKPDLAATDCGKTTFFAFESGGSWRFCGTSAAAPHAAAVAALMRDAEPTLTPAQIRTALLASGQPVGAFGADAIGAGLLDAVSALGQVAEPQEPGSEGETPEEGGEEEGGGGFEVVEQGGTTPPPIEGEEDERVNPPRSQTSKGAPQTFFRRHPPKQLLTHHHTATAVFRFGSNQSGVVFSCRIDGGPFRPCAENLTRHFDDGPHSLRVVASNAEGSRDRSPATYRFTVRTVR